MQQACKRLASEALDDPSVSIEPALSSALAPAYRASVEFGILGPLQVSAAEQLVALGGPKQRLVLALLVVEAGRVVAVDALIERIWGDDPPDAARSSLQAYVSRLRKALGPDRIEARRPGYVLRADVDEIDALRFERSIRAAHRLLDDDPQAARVDLEAALRLWRGAALADLADEPSLRAEITRLEEMRIAAIEDRAQADLVLGRQTELIPELELLLAEHGLRERLWASLMVGLYRAGRQADALGAYQRARRLLRDELGIDPSPDLQRLHERILKQDPDLDLRGRRLRGYELIERIGEGAFGVVHRAYQPGVGRDVAIKVIHLRFANDPEFVRRFEQEARLVARLEHPHIVPLYDYWREPDGAYLAMRYLRGGSLRDVIEANGPMTADAAVRIVDQVASALAAAHREGVIHRDVRPANILFDEDGNAYLSDFGIAKEVATARAPNRRAGGRAFYIAPEEIRDEPVSPATDVYSLGLVLYELLAGEHPFADTPASEVRDRQLKSPVPPIERVRRDLPVAVSAVIERATAKDAGARYPSAPDLAAALRAALVGAAAAPVAEADARNPYKGLRPFEEADAADFFGRDDVVVELLAQLAGSGPSSRFIAIVGPSGSGKSSVVAAGLIPALRAGAIVGSDRWFIVEMHPGAHPFVELERAMWRVAVHRPPSLLEELERDERGLVRVVDWILPDDASELLLVIDQFEELFTLTRDDERTALLAALASALEDPKSRARVVITLRGDFYDRPLADARFGELVAGSTHALTAMGAGGLERAIAGPAERVGVGLDQRLLGEILADVTRQPGSLPLLQYALTEAFEARAGAVMTVDVYHETGGVLGAISRRAEFLLERLDDGGRETARQVFLRLVTLGEEGAENTRRRVLRADLLSVGGDSTAVERVLDLYGSHRLLSFDRDPLTRGPTVELAHEALLAEWPRLREWIAAARDDLAAARRLATETRQWGESGRDPSYLLRGFRLDQSEAWAAETDVALSGPEREYLDASIGQRDEERADEAARQRRETSLQRRSVVRLRALVAVLMAGILVAGGLTLFAADRSRQAEREARVATARELAAAAKANLGVDAERSLLLALEAAETTRRVDGTVLPEAEEALHAALQADRLMLTVPGSYARFNRDGSKLLVSRFTTTAEDDVPAGSTEAVVYDARTGTRLAGHVVPDRLVSTRAMFGPNERWFVNQTVDGGLTAYDLDGTVRWRIPGVCCNDSWMDESGRYLATIGFPDGLMHVIDTQNGEAVNAFDTGPMGFAPDGVRGVGFNNGLERQPDGRAVAGYLGQLHEPDGGELTTLYGHEGNVLGSSWSRDGTMLVAVSPGEGTIWDTATGQLEVAFFPPDTTFTSVAFDDAATRVATGMADGTTIVWGLVSGHAEPILRLAGHGTRVGSVGFGPDGTRLVTGGEDGKVKVWDVTVEGGRESATLPGRDALAWSRDGRLLAVGGERAVTVYDAATGARLQSLAVEGSGVRGLDFSANGALFAATVAADPDAEETNDAVEIWSTGTWERVTRLNVDGVWTVAFGPTGSTLAVADSMAVRLLDAETGEITASLSVPAIGECCLNSLAFGPDGTELMGSYDGSIWLWDVEGPLYEGSRLPHGASATAYAPDGRRLYVGSHDGVGAWDAETRQQLEWHTRGLAQVQDIALTPDGSVLATMSADGVIRLWDAETLELRLTMASGANHVDEPRSSRAEGRLRFSPDGSRLAFTSANGTVRVVTLITDDLMVLARSRIKRQLSVEECQVYLHVDPCPHLQL